jgi:two-component system, NarL family, sensor histidine kinase UhpB
MRTHTLFRRIALGNAVIIVIGAVGGTLLTLHLAGRAVAPWLILFFATAGVALSLVINNRIVRTALRPIHQLRTMVDALHPGASGIEMGRLEVGDPDIARLAEAINRMYLELEDGNRRLHALSERFIHAQEEERQRIARSLHDDTIQALSSLAIGLDRLGQQLPGDLGDARAALADTRALTLRTLHELRNIVHGLRPAILDDLGLVPAIRSHARAVLETAGVRVDVDAPDEALTLPADESINLFRIAQEAVSNIVRHAGARHVVIVLRQEGELVRLSVEDDGRGFDVQRTLDQALRTQRLGLLGIHERAQLFGGSATVTSEPGQGTRIAVSFPVTATGEVDDE